MFERLLKQNRFNEAGLHKAFMTLVTWRCDVILPRRQVTKKIINNKHYAMPLASANE
jgi:hypothetical protein